MKNVLIINAHQPWEGISTGKLNNALAGIIQNELAERFHVRTTTIEPGYDIAEEIEKHEWADIIITQTPCYWFGAPWIYKKYIDEVFTGAMLQGRLLTGDGRTRTDPAKQYGTGGTMQGTQLLMSITFNAPEEAFGNPAQKLLEGKTVDDLFTATTAVYKFCGAEVLPAFACYNVLKDPHIESDIAKLRARLAELR